MSCESIERKIQSPDKNKESEPGIEGVVGRTGERELGEEDACQKRNGWKGEERRTYAGVSRAMMAVAYDRVNRTSGRSVADDDGILRETSVG